MANSIHKLREKPGRPVLVSLEPLTPPPFFLIYRITMDTRQDGGKLGTHEPVKRKRIARHSCLISGDVLVRRLCASSERCLR